MLLFPFQQHDPSHSQSFLLAVKAKEYTYTKEQNPNPHQKKKQAC